MRERIRLTPEERQQLDLIEQRLRNEDPAFVRRLGFRESRRKRFALACAAVLRSSRTVPAAALTALLSGAVVTVAGLPNVPLAAVGYLTMVAGALVLASRGPVALRVIAQSTRRVLSRRDRDPS